MNSLASRCIIGSTFPSLLQEAYGPLLNSINSIYIKIKNRILQTTAGKSTIQNFISLTFLKSADSIN